jgi:hypothetical protein
MSVWEDPRSSGLSSSLGGAAVWPVVASAQEQAVSGVTINLKTKALGLTIP